jgi:hypothetical protein
MAIRRDDLPTNFQWAFKRRRRRKCPLSFMRVLVYRLPLISFLTKQHGRPAANRPHWEKTSQTPPTFPFLRVAIYISDTCCHWKSFRLEPKRKKKLPPNYLNECKFVCLFLSENKNNQFYFSDWNSFILHEFRMTMALKIVVSIFILALPFLTASNSDSA